MNALEPKSGGIDAVTFNTRPSPGLNSAVSNGQGGLPHLAASG